MTTYGGRRSGYIPGQRPVNKEPPVAKYVIEKLYQVHRERLVKVKSLTDCKLHVMDFLTDQTWKKTAAYHQELRIMKHNEEMYERIAKVENNESIIAKEKREHIKKVTEGARVMDRLKAGGRERKILQIQKENEHFHARLQKAQGEYTQKKCKEWYKHHELFKQGRRADVTAGHIMNVPKRLLPKSLPPLHPDLISGTQELGSINNEVHSRAYNSASADGSTASYGAPRVRKSQKQSVDASAAGVTLGSTGSIGSAPDDASVFFDVPTGTFSNPIESKRYRDLTASPVTAMKEATSDQPRYKDSKNPSKHNSAHNIMALGSLEDDRSVSSVGSSQKELVTKQKSQSTLTTESLLQYDDDEHAVHVGKEMSSDVPYLMMTQRQFAIPFDHRNCVVQIFLSDHYDEYIYFRIISSHEPLTVLSTRAITIDQFFDIARMLARLPEACATENVAHLRNLLTNMFHEADVDDSGSLSFDEFQSLMEKIDLGITSQELRFVISEADENADGVVDYEEFVPIAVDMILAFRARTSARKMVTNAEMAIDESIHENLRSAEDLVNITKYCTEKILSVDPKRTGVIRPNDLRRKLQGAAMMGLSPLEINMICQSLPRDPFGRCIYEHFKDTLYDVRFIAMKNAIMESQGSQLQNVLLDICRAEEQDLREDLGDDIAVPGMIPVRNLINRMIKSSRLSLNRLQVMVIVSEANVVDGMVNYHSFVPVAAKAIEMMFDPNSLRVRSELMDKTDFSAAAILEGESSEEFHKRLVHLFHSYDIKHSGELNPREFSNCMQSLDLHLTPSEVFALMASADVDHSGTVSFEEFVSFCTHNLLHLEKEKRLRQARASQEGRPVSQGGSQLAAAAAGSGNKTFDDMFSGNLMAVFQDADSDGNGVLDAAEVHSLLQAIDVNLTPFQLDVLLSEMDTNDDNRITYAEFVPVCAELLEGFKARSAASPAAGGDRAIGRLAAKLVNAYYYEIEHIANFVFERLVLIYETIEDMTARRMTIKEFLYDPMTCLCRSEANMLLAKICPSQSVAELGIMGMFTANKLEEAAASASATEDVSRAQSRVGSRAASPTQGSLSRANSGTSTPTGKREHANRKKKAAGLKQELSSLIKRVKETTIKRSIVDPPNAAKIEKKILAAIVEVLRKITKADGDNINTRIYVPVRLVFEVLAKEVSLRLSLPQILHIIQYADCFEIGTTGVNYQQFAAYAAEKIVYLTSQESMQHRIDILDHVGNDPLNFMYGLTEEEFNEYCVEKFSAVADAKHEVTEMQFCEIMALVPNVELHDTETLALISAFPHTNNSPFGNIRWKEFMSWGYTMLTTLCRERIIGRRLMLQTTVSCARDAKLKYEQFMDKSKEVSNPAAKLAMEKQMLEAKTYEVTPGRRDVFVPIDKNAPLYTNIEKLLDVLKLSTRNGLCILLPNEKGRDSQATFGTHSGARGSSPGDKGYKKSHMLRQLTRQSSRVGEETMSGDQALSKLAKLIPVTGNVPSHLTTTKTAPTTLLEPIPGAKYLPCLVSMVAVSQSVTAMDRALMVRIVSMHKDNVFDVELQAPLRLPSVGLVDKESAAEFCQNLMEKVELKFDKSGNPQLIILSSSGDRPNTGESM